MVAIVPFSILEFQVECNFIVFSLNVKRNWQTKRASQYLSPEGGESWTIFFLGGGHSRRQRGTEGRLFL